MGCGSVKQRIWGALCQRVMTMVSGQTCTRYWLLIPSCPHPCDPLSPLRVLGIYPNICCAGVTCPATNLLPHLFSFFHLGLVSCKLSELNPLMEGCSLSGWWWGLGKEGDRRAIPVLLKCLELEMLER